MASTPTMMGSTSASDEQVADDSASVDSTTGTPLSKFFLDADLSDPFPATFFQGDNVFKRPGDDQSTGSGHPFFSANQKKDKNTV
jgi:hypothetical protein